MFLLLIYQLFFQVFNLHIFLIHSTTLKLMKTLPILWIQCNFQTVSSRSIKESPPATKTLPLFWFSLKKCQIPINTSVSLPLLKWTGGRKCNESLVG